MPRTTPSLKDGTEQFLNATKEDHKGFTAARLREILASAYDKRTKFGMIRTEAGIASLNTVKSWIKYL